MESDISNLLLDEFLRKREGPLALFNIHAYKMFYIKILNSDAMCESIKKSFEFVTQSIGPNDALQILLCLFCQHYIYIYMRSL